LLKDGKKKVGCVTKQFSGVVRELFTNADNFGITCSCLRIFLTQTVFILVPMDLDVKMKATLLGAMFLIDFTAFEHTGNNSSATCCQVI
jgi:hypothetical protein